MISLFKASPIFSANRYTLSALKSLSSFTGEFQFYLAYPIPPLKQTQTHHPKRSEKNLNKN
jgi:hypothetical protein